LFRCTAQAQPTHTTHITHTWGGVQHRRAAWDSYVQNPTFVTQETSNDKFTIPESVLPLASKWQVITILKPLKEKKKEKKKTSKGALTS